MTTDGEPPGMVNANAEKAADLFDRYYNRLYDFCLRVLGLPDAATDATQEAFQNAMVAPQWGSSFDIILFSAALDSLEPRLKLRHPSSIGSNPLFHQVDVARLADPTRAPTAQETGGLIWETMSRLDPADYVLLDLRFRQNLDEADLAAVLRTNERAIHTRLTNLLRRTEPELSSLIVGRRGSRSCEGMRRAMLGLPIAATREQVRKAVEKHARSCPVCTATRAGLTSPLLVLASFALVTPAAAESGTARAKLLAAASAIPSTLSVAPEHIPAPLPDVGPAAPPPPPPPPQPAVPSGAGGFGEKTAFGGSGGAGMGGAGGFGGGYMSGMGRGGSGRLFGGLQLPSGMALPILGIVIIFALALLIACGTGLFAGGGGGKPTPTATAAKKPAATATAKPVDTPTTEEGTPTEEPTATPEEGQPPAASATPVPPTIGPATNTPVPPPTDTPAAPPTDTPAPVTPEGSATPCLPENGCFT